MHLTRFHRVALAGVCFVSFHFFQLPEIFAASSNESKYEIQIMGKSFDVRIASSDEKSRSSEVRFANGAKGIVFDSVIIGYENRSDIQSILSYNSNVTFIDELNVAILRVPTAKDALIAARDLVGLNRFRYVHPDLRFAIEERQAFPTDEPFYQYQWNLHGSKLGVDGLPSDVGIEAAWKITQGREDLIVGVLDLGFEQTHEDLIESWAINTKEIPGNKKDDDGNGFVDDVVGWNFSVNGPNLIYGQNSKHGTATAGIVGARVNGVGIAGICPRCKVLPIVISGRVSEDAQAILYAVKRGASVMTNSWGYNLESPTTDVVSDALKFAKTKGRDGKGIPIVFAMHNASVDDCRNSNPDISGDPSVIAVSSVDVMNQKVEQSGYGKCLAFVAPSSGSALGGIATTDRMGKEGYNANGDGNFSNLAYHNGFWGTSAAAPQVAGIFALLLSAEPNLTRDEAFDRLKQSALKVNSTTAQYDQQSGRSIRYGFGKIDARSIFE